MAEYPQHTPEISEIIKTAEKDFNDTTTTTSKYVDVSISEDINKIYAYLESKHISGGTDSMGRDKPFFNIVIAARNITFRSTDIDRSNIKLRSTKAKDDIGAFLATIHLQDWMRRSNFGAFLNDWGLNSAAFNESVLKFVEKDGELYASVVPWSRIIFDVIDFDNNPKIEIIEMTPSQLRKNKNYDQDQVKALCAALSARETKEGQTKDSKSAYVRVYEVHGEFPLWNITKEEEDVDEYVQQMHVISFVAKNDNPREEDVFTLYSGREEKDPYMIGSLLPETDGSIMLRGSVKTLFDAQWMQNHSVKTIKDQLDLASKLIFQTSDPNFASQNVLTSIQNGDILIHKTNEPLTQISNNPDIAALQSFRDEWKSLGNEITGVSQQMLGEQAKSGTAWRQVEALLNESHSLFETMTENKGLAIEKMMREYIIPFLKKKMNNSKEIAATLSDYDVTRIDARYIKNSAIERTNKYLKEKILNGEEVTTEMQDAVSANYEGMAKSTLNQQGANRYFSPSEIDDATWNDILKDIEWEIEVDVTNENVDKEAMTTLNTLFQIVTDPVRSQMLDTPRGKFIFNRILQMTGAVSTIEMNSLPENPPQPMQPTQGNTTPAQAPSLVSG